MAAATSPTHVLCTLLGLAAVAAASGAVAAACEQPETCRRAPPEPAPLEAPGVLLVQAKQGLSRVSPGGQQPAASLAAQGWPFKLLGDKGRKETQGGGLTCTLGDKVTISSHRFQNLQDNQGVLNLHGDATEAEQWTLADAGNGLVTIRSAAGRFLADEGGKPVLLAEVVPPSTSWAVRQAGDGKVHLASHRGSNLGDWEGTPTCSENQGAWEEWFIAELDGSLACKAGNAEACQQELASIRKRLAEAQQLLFRTQAVLDNGCGTATTTPGTRPNVGRCAVFGDPHFITFDGGHTTFVGEKLIWIVRSDNVWMQAVSTESTGNFMGLAIGGPFLQGHTLIVYNNSDGGPLRVTYDGQPILQAPVDEFHSTGVLDAWRSESWDASLHDDEILELRTEGRFAIGPWPERFLGSPAGGLFLFRFPGSVEVTVTGVDFMSSVITMPPQGSQCGFCGNYNGHAHDDFEPVIPSWNKPIGRCLEAVAEAENLFKGSEINLGPGLLATGGELRAEGQRRTLESVKRVQDQCPPALRAQAKEQCKKVSDERLRIDCEFDICATGDVGAAQGMLAAEVMNLKVATRGSVAFVGAGRCLDATGRMYQAWKTTDVRTAEACKELLHELAFTQGVLGAELLRTDSCQIITEAGVDLSATAVSGQWRQGGPVVEASPAGSGLVSAVQTDPAWSCWATI